MLGTLCSNSLGCLHAIGDRVAAVLGGFTNHFSDLTEWELYRQLCFGRVTK